MYRYNGRLVAEYQDEAGSIEVVEHDGLRSLHFGSAVRQSSMVISAPARLHMPYEQAMMGCLLFNPEPVRMLLIGLGGGSISKFLLEHCEHTHVQVVEQRARVVDVAREHFALPQDVRLAIAIGCGARHVADAKGSYDIIVVDAYGGSGMAPEVASEEFFRHCRDLLTGNGMLVINLWRSDKELLALATRNLVTAFDWRAHSIPLPEEGSLIGFAFPPGFPRQSLSVLKARAVQLQRQLALDFPAYLNELRNGDPMEMLFVDE